MRKYLLAPALLLPGLALANGYNAPNTNTRDLGLADSARAAQFSAAAAYANPAALAGLEGLNLSLAIPFSISATNGTGLAAQRRQTPVFPAR